MSQESKRKKKELTFAKKKMGERKTTLLRESNWGYFCHYDNFLVLFQFSPPFGENNAILGVLIAKQVTQPLPLPYLFLSSPSTSVKTTRPHPR